MAETERPLNYCYECPNTWYPRGKDLSERCPKCKSEKVTNETILEAERARVRAIKAAELAKLDEERRRAEAEVRRLQILKWQENRRRNQEEFNRFCYSIVRLDSNFVVEFCFKLGLITLGSISALILGIRYLTS